MSTYLTELTLRLAHGVGLLPSSSREQNAAYFCGLQNADGGWSGREGSSDLYYTGFALRALAILGELAGDRAARAGEFLRGKLAGQESIVDFFSLIYATQLLNASAGIDVFAELDPRWRNNVAEKLQRLRRDDGGFAKTFEGHSSSTYQTFLVLLCLEMLQMPLEQPEQVIDFLNQRHQAEGGFLEIKAGKRAGVNPTAAAIASLKILQALDQDHIARTVEFLIDAQSDEGGFCANTRIPLADLLSTFTGLLTLIDLQASEQIDRPALQRFVIQLQRPEGGFHAGLFDPAHDVEYSFYGLGCRALLAGLEADDQPVAEGVN